MFKLLYSEYVTESAINFEFDGDLVTFQFEIHKMLFPKNVKLTCHFCFTVNFEHS